MRRMWLCMLGLLPVLGHAAPVSHDGKVVLFGNLHAHSNLSDDTRGPDASQGPEAGFLHAMEHGLDFLAITDHHKAVDCNNRFFLTAEEYEQGLIGVAARLNAEHVGSFVAIPGIEWGNTATGNHLNVLGARELPPDTILDRDYDALFAWAQRQHAVVQFNHPRSWNGSSKRDKTVGNFGEALYPSTLAWAEAIDPVVSAVSIICSVQGGHISGAHRKSEAKTHREMQWERQYQYFLNAGLRIGPSANQDTHGKNFGTVTAARTAVWADAFTYEGVLDALRASRIYATEDDELVVAFSVVAPDGTSAWMGADLGVGEGEAELQARVWIEQAEGSDGDPRDEGPYTIELIGDEDGVGGQEASVWTRVEGVQAGVVHPIDLFGRAGQYVYVRVVEENGRDNPVGQGVDEVDARTGAHRADGLRDDLNDAAWTTPVFFVEAAATTQPLGVDPGPGEFVWSKRSAVYHQPDCWAAARISESNRMVGTAEAAGDRRLHDCRPPAAAEPSTP